MDKINEMNLEQINTRKVEIGVILNGDSKYDVDELEKEIDALEARSQEIKANVEKRNNLVAKVLENGTVIPKKEAEDMEKREYGLDSKIYRNAFLKTLRNVELNTEERAAYKHNTTNSKALIPTDMENKIYSNMEETHPILSDVRQLRTGTSFSITKHTAIVAGDAKVVAEGLANDDEENTFTPVTLVGKKFSKHLEYTYELEAMAMDAFEQYIVDEISDRIGSAMASEIVRQIKADLAVSNKITAELPGTLVLKDILKGLAQLKATKRVYIYVNNETLFGSLAALEGDTGRLSFIPNYAENISGQLLGKAIKEEDAVPAGEILIVDPNQFLWNVVKPVEILRDRDVKTGDYVMAGHSLAGGSMTNDKAGALITVGVDA